MRYLISIFILSLLLSSCRTTVPFTKTVKDNCGLTNSQLKGIQFYTSTKIVLYKIKEQSDATINKGKIIVSNQKDAETIIIDKGTPCVLVETMTNVFLLSFEYGDGKLLAFGTTSGGVYSLMGKSWNGSNGVIEYGHRMYQTNNGDAYLKVKMKHLNKAKKKYRVVQGRTIDR